MNKKFIVGAGVMALVVIAFTAGYFFNGGPREEADEPKTAREQLEAELASADTSDAAAFRNIQKNFPDEYGQLLDMVLEKTEAGASAVEIEQASAQFTANIRKSNAPHAYQAPDDALIAVLDMQIEAHEFVQTKWGYQTCQRYAMEGPMGFVGTPLMNEMIDRLGEQSTALLTAIAEGRDHPVGREPLRADDWQKVADSIPSSEEKDRYIALISGMQVDEEDVCIALIWYLTAMRDAKTDGAERVRAEFVSSLAAN